jgi:hypothetical protein
MEKMENKERFPLSHGTTTAISMDLMNDLAASSEVSRNARVDATPQAAGNY